MAIHCEVLGKLAEDNALWIEIDTGQARHSLLIDCGEETLAGKRISDLHGLDHIFFSHFHMDHICGFDRLFRHLYNRERPVHVWGPAGTIEVMHHRFRGFLWNLVEGESGEWHVHEIDQGTLRHQRFLTATGFEPAGEIEETEFTGVLLEHADFRIEAMPLPHGNTTSIGYQIFEASQTNVDTEVLKTLGLRPGPWLGRITNPDVPDDIDIEVGDTSRSVRELRELLLKRSPGQRLAALTDFRIETEEQQAALVQWIASADTLVCESQYLGKDDALARQNGHLTTRLVGELAAAADVGELVLQHLSRRYSPEEREELLAEVRSVFPAVRYHSE